MVPPKPDRVTTVHTAKNYAIRIADGVMCCVALGGLANVAVGVASFTYEKRLRQLGESIHVLTPTWPWIAYHLGMASVGFLYMAWRQDWHYSLAGLLKVIALWCLLFAEMQLPWEAAGYAIGFTDIFILLYAIRWARRQRLPGAHE